MIYKYMNMYTGELYRNLFHAARTIAGDMIHCPSCRTWKMFKLKRGQW